MIKINSELPLCMLGQNNDLNEYDFVLFHLYDSNEDYRNYYLNQRKIHPDRLMIFDNSAYEFYVKGETLDKEKFYRAICELQPDYYILPDTLMNKDKTIEDTDEFMRVFGDALSLGCVDTKPLAVVQGNSFDEMVECLDHYYQNWIDAIAFPFHNSFFKTMDIDDDIYWEFVEEFGGDNEDAQYAMGRVQMMRILSKMDLLSDFKHIHMLGSHQPFEKQWYSEFDTMDTGYPVKCAMVDEKLEENYIKPNIIIDDFLETDLEQSYRDLIADNVTSFKNMSMLDDGIKRHVDSNKVFIME